MQSDDGSAQLTRCSGQTEATSGRIIEQPSAIEVRTGEGGQTKEVASSPAPQQVKVSAKAADDSIANPEVAEEVEEDVVVEEETEEDTKADLQQNELPRDDPLPDLPALDRGNDPNTFNIFGADLAGDAA